MRLVGGSNLDVVAESAQSISTKQVSGVYTLSKILIFISGNGQYPKDTFFGPNKMGASTLLDLLKAQTAWVAISVISKASHTYASSFSIEG